MDIQFGTGRRNITPRVPVSLAGYFNIRMWDHVLDDIEVRAAVFRSGDTAAGILHFDLVGVPLSLCDEILRGLRKTGIDFLSRENLLISATHTHTAPEIRPGKRGRNPEYEAFLVNQALEALRDAAADWKTGEMLHATASEHRYLFNRRFWMKDGTVMTNPGKGNPDILRPEGDIDPEIPMIGIRRGGRLELLLTSIVNHSDTIGGNGVSADWPGFFRRSLEPELGPGSMVIPLIGAAGNINHFDVSSPACQTRYEEAERIGRGYAETVRAALSRLRPASGRSFRILFGEVPVPPREVSPEEVREAKAVMEKYADLDIDAGADMTSEDLAKGAPVVLKYFASVLLEVAENRELSHFYLHAFLFGDDAAVASLPCEPFTEIGLALRKQIFRGRTCLVSEHANGTGTAGLGGGYIPNSWNFGRGGYETMPRSDPYSSDAASLLLEGWAKLARGI